MRILVIGLIVLALSVAGISTYLIKNFSTPAAIQELEKKAEPVKTQILVATTSLNPGDRLSSSNVAWRPWPKDSVNELYFSVERDDQREEKFQEIDQSVVRRPVLAGEPIIAAKFFKSKAAGFMAGMLDKGMRAVSIPVTATNGVAGFVLPGDHVDVLVVHDRGKEAIRQATPERKKVVGEVPPVEPLIVMKSMTETVLENILVMAVDQTVGGVATNSLPAKTLTLQLTPRQSEILLTARALGQLSIVLRDIGSTSVKIASDAGTYTTDVQASPFLRNISEEIRKRSARQKKKARELALKKPEPAVPSSAIRKVAPSANKQVIEIYRGSAAKTEEITVK